MDQGHQSQSNGLRLLYVTAPNREKALGIGRILVKERLVACVNLFAPIHSIYRWESQVEEAQEVVFVCKTTASLVQAVSQRIQALHPYQCPCVLSLPIEAMHPAYKQWLRETLQ